MSTQQNEWSTKWPTEPGWYWMADESGWLEVAEFGLGPRDSIAVVACVSHPSECDGSTAFLRIDQPDLVDARRALRGES